MKVTRRNFDDFYVSNGTDEYKVRVRHLDILIGTYRFMGESERPFHVSVSGKNHEVITHLFPGNKEHAEEAIPEILELIRKESLVEKTKNIIFQGELLQEKDDLDSKLCVMTHYLKEYTSSKDGLLLNKSTLEGEMKELNCYIKDYLIRVKEIEEDIQEVKSRISAIQEELEELEILEEMEVVC